MRSLLLRTSAASSVAFFALLAACGDDDAGFGSSSGDDDVDASQGGSTSGSANGSSSSGVAGSSSSGSGGAGSSSGSSSGAADASSDGEAGVCDTTGYPIDYASSADELAAVQAAIDAYEAANVGVTVTIDDATKAIAAVDGEPPIALDEAIDDPCTRASTALLAYLDEHADIFRTPPGMTQKSCQYDDLFDAEVIRLQGGTYFDRPMLSQATEVLAHVTRDGHLRFFAGAYVPVLARTNVASCLTGAEAAAATVGASLGYQKFQQCAPQGPGSIEITEADTRTPLDTGVFLDENGKLHDVRAVDVLLAADRVGSEQSNSDLYCCSQQSVVGCVGKTLLVDELTGEVLAEIPRCHTC